jgi:hypothetical protein
MEYETRPLLELRRRHSGISSRKRHKQQSYLTEQKRFGSKFLASKRWGA